MIFNRRSLLGIVAGVAGTIAISACNEADIDPVTVPAREVEAEIESLPTPLSDLLDLDDVDLNDREVLVHDWVSECMAKLGFEYIPPVPELSPDVVSTESFVDGLRRNREAPQSADVVVDPEQPPEYGIALWGPAPDDSMAIPEEIVSGDPAEVGCYNAAWVNLFSASSVEARLRLIDALGDIRELVRANPAVNDRIAEFEVCLRSTGLFSESSLSTSEVILDEYWNEEFDGSDDSWERLAELEKDLNEAEGECGVDEVRLLEAQIASDEEVAAYEELEDEVALIRSDIEGF